MYKDFEGSKVLSWATIIVLFGSLVASLVYFPVFFNNIPSPAIFFFFLWLVAAIAFSLLSLKQFTIGWLLATFCLLISARIMALHQQYLLASVIMIGFAFLFLNFLYCAWLNIRYPQNCSHQVSLLGWQLIFIRIYIGFDFIPHFTEKLFAGYQTYFADVKDFTSLGVPDPAFFVVLAGLCEFASAIGIGLGLFLRAGSFGAVLYLFIASLLGNHYHLGFIWANPGGGWEFVTMWMVLIFTFVVTGYHEFSLDHRLEEKVRFPLILKRLL